MILSSRSLESLREVTSNICIIGAGAAGITLASELDGCGALVVVLESGGIGALGGVSQDPYVGVAEGGHPPPSHFRRLAFGGTTTIWGGRCVPFDPIDFERRAYVANSGWPIGYDEVAPYYPKAMRYCDAGSFDFSASGSMEDQDSMVSGLGACAELKGDLIERFSLPTDFGSRYREKLARSKNVRVITHAHATKVLKDPVGDRIEAAEFVARSGKIMRLSAQIFVLATGGIESARFLLASDLGGVGLGNHSDCVGRYYTCHLENVIGLLMARGRQVHFDFEKTSDGVYARRKIQLPESVQRDNAILNIAFRLHYPNIADPEHRSSVLSAMFLAKRTLIPEYRRILQHSTEGSVSFASVIGHLRNMALGTPELLRFLGKWTKQRLWAQRKLPYVLVAGQNDIYPVEFHAEQTPQRESRILLTDEKDGFGVPRVRIAWKTCDADIESICKAYRLLNSGIGSLDGCKLIVDDSRLWELAAESQPVGGHHIGATRMGSAPSVGVVDKDCAVFGLPNLFVASSAVFPTSSHANPTLTIVAMTLRLADHLRRVTASQVLN